MTVHTLHAQNILFLNYKISSLEQPAHSCLPWSPPLCTHVAVGIRACGIWTGSCPGPPRTWGVAGGCFSFWSWSWWTRTLSAQPGGAIFSSLSSLHLDIIWHVTAEPHLLADLSVFCSLFFLWGRNSLCLIISHGYYLGRRLRCYPFTSKDTCKIKSNQLFCCCC